jgi:hypothetical protein
MEAVVCERVTTQDVEAITVQMLINICPVVAPIKEFSEHDSCRSSSTSTTRWRVWRTSVVFRPWALVVGGSAFAGDHDVADAELVQVVLDAGFAVAAVRGYRAWFPAGAFDHPFDSGFQPGSIGGVAWLHIVVQHDPVVVVADLGLVAELDRFPEPALSDRPGVRIVQADLPSRTVGDMTVGVAVDLDVQRLPQDHLPFVDTRHRDDHGEGDA